jgi:hypothetical protein
MSEALLPVEKLISYEEHPSLSLRREIKKSQREESRWQKVRNAAFARAEARYAGRYLGAIEPLMSQPMRVSDGA